MRFFNTAGPIRPEKHYCIPPLERLNLPQVLRLIGQEKYFGLHAPRQTGKTSALLALRDLLNTSRRLPHSINGRKRGHHRRQRVQHQGRIAAAGGLLAARGADIAGAAHLSDRPSLRG